jgi:uncharacterized protein (TIGR00290 family)
VTWGEPVVPGAKLICLLPVRNGEAHLPEYLTAVARFADGVVALDFGSSDRTRDVLASNSLVKAVLSGPERLDGSIAWDAAGHDRLLAAASELTPDWLITLGATERFADDDAAALRAFVATQALPGLAYGFRVYRMHGDRTHFDRAGRWVYRLFAFAPGQRFSRQQPRFVPIPDGIPRERWLRTTIRVQDVAGLTAPSRSPIEWTAGANGESAVRDPYRDLLDANGVVKPWIGRPPDHPPLLVGGEQSGAISSLEPRSASPPIAAPIGGDPGSASAPLPAIQVWSGGKDSAFALWATRLRGEVDVQALVTIVLDRGDRAQWHGVRTELLRRQAAAIGLPLHEVRLAKPDLESKTRALIDFLRSPTAQPFAGVVWGDLFLTEARAWHEQIAASAGKTAIFPLWGANTPALARAIAEAGFAAVLTAVSPNALDPSWAGREFDEALLSELPEHVDPCGEAAEFHTFVYDGPNFCAPVAFRRGRRIRIDQDDQYVFCDLEPIE